jgi:type I restriction enzyme S subunit
LVEHEHAIALAVEQAVRLLREFRTRLVADVVTGKLDVREAARHLPDDEEPLPEAGEADEDLGDETDLEEEDP